MFSNSNLMCSFVWKHLIVCQVNIFFMFWGKITYFIKKKSIFLRFVFNGLPINVISLGFLLMILINGLLKSDSSVAPTLATVGNLFYRQNSKMAAKWRHTFWMFLCFFVKVWYMLPGVLEVIESVSSAIMSIRFHLSPYSEQEAQN